MGSDEVKDKVKKTMLERYGIENYLVAFNRSEEFKELRKDQTWNTIQSYKDYVIPLFKREDLEKQNERKTYRWKCVKCGHEFEDHIHKTSHVEEFHYLPRCEKCFPYLNGISNEEKELFKFIRSIYDGEILENDRKLISPYELDVVLPGLKLAFEFDGSFWHSTSVPRYDASSHLALMKTKECNKKGYRLIHIWEDEWNDITKERIELVLNGTETVDFSHPLDRSWYNNLPGDFEVLPPRLIRRGKFDVENCGYLILKGNK